VFAKSTRPIRDRLERRHAPVGDDGVDQVVVCDLVTEVVGVGAYSVVTLVGGRHHYGQHLALRPRELAGPMHHRDVQPHRVAQRSRFEPLNSKDVENTAGAFSRLGELPREFALSLVFIDHLDTRYKAASLTGSGAAGQGSDRLLRRPARERLLW